jgi:hypothetical protein
MFIVYCDPKADKATYDRILDSMISARKKMPIELRTDSDSDMSVNRDKDILFIVTSIANLRLFKFDTDFKGA